MIRRLFIRAWLIVAVFATIGLGLGMLGASVWNSRGERFTAEATVAMLPAQDVSASEASNLWEVLNRGQATRTAAVVLGDAKWLDGAASASGEPKSDLSVSAGAIPDTTLITVTMKANSAKAAEVALQEVLDNAMGTAATVSGPFGLQVVASPSGTAHSMRANPVRMLAAFGIAGLLVGAGCGVLVNRSVRLRSPLPSQSGSPSVSNELKRRQHARSDHLEKMYDGVDHGEADTKSFGISWR